MGFPDELKRYAAPPPGPTATRPRGIKATLVRWPAEMRPPAEFLDRTIGDLEPIVKKVEKLEGEVLGNRELEDRVEDIHRELTASITMLEIARDAIRELAPGPGRSGSADKRAGAPREALPW